MAVAGVARSVATAFTGFDPGMERFRLAVMTIVTLMVTLTALLGLVQILGQPVTVAIPG